MLTNISREKLLNLISFPATVVQLDVTSGCMAPSKRHINIWPNFPPHLFSQPELSLRRYVEIKIATLMLSLYVPIQDVKVEGCFSASR